ncbi:hypothetical protein WDW37_17505 [Bdellovibrionota bacterium FG-1]
MDWFNHVDLNRHLASLYKRISTLSIRLNPSAASPRVIQGLKTTFFLTLALVLGVWAHDFSEAQALNTWLTTHPPSILMWKHALRSRGMVEVTHPILAQKAIRTLPSLIDQKGAVWVASEGKWIALLGSDTASGAPVVFCLSCQETPQNWNPAGNAWSAFDVALKKVDEAVQAEKHPLLSAKKAVYRDPYEIVY